MLRPHHLKPLLLSLSFLFTSATSFAGYDKTSWGMPIKQVQKHYPGGTLQELQNGTVSYSLIRPVAGHSTGYLRFIFEKKGLSDVEIHFPEQGTNIDLKNGIYKTMSVTSEKSTFESLQTALTRKYGPPQMLTAGSFVSFATKEKDVITLVTVPSGTERATAIILYQQNPELKDLSDGL